MSSDVESDFMHGAGGGGNGSESDFMASPVVAKKKTAAKTTAVGAKGKGKASTSAAASKATAGAKSKAAAKPKSTTKKALGSKKNPPNDSFSEVEEDEEVMDLDPSSEDDNEDDEGTNNKKRPAVVGGQGTKKNASDMYQKLSQLEHILKRPDSYIGSVEHLQAPMWVFDKETKKMVNKNISYVPGFFKIFDEILVNAADNKINDPTMDTFKVSIDREANTISVYNNGKGIPIEIHSKEKVWIPEMIFGHLLTSSNYDDDQKKLTGGRNGYGAKLANIYSLEFVVETADRNTLKKYKQVFTNNMSTKGTPKITDNKKGDEWTKITFKPDLARFGMDVIDDDTEALLMKRVYDMAGTVRDCKVFLNDERLKIKGFKQYIEMYLAASIEEKTAVSGGAAIAKPTIIYETSPDGRWEVGFVVSDGQFQQVSFANSISTTKGGTHVEAIANILANKLMDQIKKKNKAAPVKPFQIKNHMWLFVNALIENPAFDSQTKETLTLKPSAFGSKVGLSDSFVTKVSKSGIVDNVLNWAKFKSDQMMKKTDGNKRSRISGIVKLEDANNAGSKKGNLCTLILTEGDSAKALAVSGLSVVGRDNFGVFPLRGKLLNVREAGHDQIMKNVEIQHIKQIMGLKHNTEYTSVDGLRYGKLMIMTDQDHDGSHIKGLIINFLDHFYPSLLKIPGFLLEFITPIVKVTKGKQTVTFYTIPEYEEWKEQNNDGKGWDSKYYKGLGTSTAQDAKKYFSDLEKHRLPFQITQPGDRELVDLAFNKKKADDRKEWLRQFRPGTYLDHDIKTVPIADFINKELILFSMADNIRSIPSVADGLKPGQRKVLFGCFKRNLTKEIKVAQLVGYVAEKTAYHHGEASLCMTIVNLAQNFVGSNNINLLEPNGQFGTRIAGGKDAASARYIFTNIPRITRTLFHPHDDPILGYQIEEDMKIEPEYYLPVIPMVLVDGADGIGTGWSTAIPNYNPLDIVDNIRRKMRGEDVVRMNPWYRGFRGTIERVADDKYKCAGIINKIDDVTIEITELPVRVWTQTYKEMLESWVTGDEKTPQTLKDYREYHTDTTVHFVITMKDASEMRKAEEEGLEKHFRLANHITTGNMVCFDLNGKIRKYTSAEQILDDFYPKRLEYYAKRKENLANDLQKQYDRISNQALFIKKIIAKELTVSNKKKADIEEELKTLKFMQIFKEKTPREVGEEAQEDEGEEDERSGGYEYLLSMNLWSLTKERVEKLLKEQDERRHELEILLALSPFDMWNTDLDAFLAEWNNVLQGDVVNSKRVKPKAGTAAAKLASLKKKTKAMADSDDDFEEDFKPKAVARPRAPKASNPDSIVPAKRTGDDLDDDLLPLVKKSASISAGKKPAVKPTVQTNMLDDIDDDKEEAYVIAPKKKLTAATAVKKPRAKPAPKPKKDETEDEDADMNFSPPIIARKLPTRPGRSAKVSAYVDLSDDDEQL